MNNFYKVVVQQITCSIHSSDFGIQLFQQGREIGVGVEVERHNLESVVLRVIKFLRVGVSFLKTSKKTFLTPCYKNEITIKANAKSHTEIKYRNVNVNFKVNLIVSRKLFHKDHSSDNKSFTRLIARGICSEERSGWTKS